MDILVRRLSFAQLFLAGLCLQPSGLPVTVVSMLDDLKLIATVDKHDALGAVEKQLAQLVWSGATVTDLDLQPFDNIVFGAIGGSAWSAQFVASWFYDRLTTPTTIVRDYTLPASVGTDTLFIALSNSGNTEETLEAAEQAKVRGAQILVIAAGGQLIETAKSRGYPYIQMPGGHEPRFAALYAVRVLAQLFDKLELTRGAVKEIEDAKKWLESQTVSWLPDVPTAGNPAKRLALELAGKGVIIYSSEALHAAAYRFKMQLNENAKQVSFTGVYPEFNHNEYTGWTAQPIEKPFAIVEFRSFLDHPRIQKRFELSNRFLSGCMPAPEIITAEGATKLEQLLWLSLYGDFVSVYLAVLNQVEPMGVPLVVKLKKALKD